MKRKPGDGEAGVVLQQTGNNPGDGEAGLALQHLKDASSKKQKEVAGALVSSTTVGGTTIGGYTFPAHFLFENMYIFKLIRSFNNAKSNYTKLLLINNIQKAVDLVRYDKDHIYDQDDTALLPEWRWLNTPIETIERLRKDLYSKVYDDSGSE